MTQSPDTPPPPPPDPIPAGPQEPVPPTPSPVWPLEAMLPPNPAPTPPPQWPPQTPAPPAGPKPYGLWASLGISTLAMVVGIAASAVVLLVYVVTVGGGKQPQDVGLTTAMATFPMAAVGMAIVLGAVVLKRQSLVQYLALQWPGFVRILLSAGGLVAFILAAGAVTQGLDMEQENQFMKQLAATPYLVLVMLAVCIAAPIFEEVLFRGFLFPGVAQSALGAPGAIVLTAILWAILHIQYSVAGMGLIFALGIFLGLVRWLTRSTLVTILLHFAWNTLGMTLTWYALSHPEVLE